MYPSTSSTSASPPGSRTSAAGRRRATRAPRRPCSRTTSGRSLTRGPDDAAAGGPRPATGQRPPGQGWTRYEPPAPPAADDDPGDRAGGAARATSTRGPRRHARPPRSATCSSRSSRSSSAPASATRAATSPPARSAARSPWSSSEGSSLRAIAAELEAKGVVKHARAFVIRAEADGYATRFMPGTYAFRVNEPYDGPRRPARSRAPSPPTVKVAIPEGTTLRQAAEHRLRRGRGHLASATTSPWRATTRRRSASRATRRARRSRACSSRPPTRCCPQGLGASRSSRRSSRRSTRTSPRST